MSIELHIYYSGQRAIGPFDNPDHENSRALFRVIGGDNWRTGQIRAPVFRRIAKRFSPKIKLSADFVARVYEMELISKKGRAEEYSCYIKVKSLS